MKLKITKDWLNRKAAQDDNLEVAAGSFPAEILGNQGASLPELGRTIPAFGKLINLCRRRNRMRMEQLAEAAAIDVDEIILIELNPAYVPEPRTVFQLSRVLGLPERRMLELSGNLIARDMQLCEHAVLFAARSQPLELLTSEELEALNDFVTFLSGK